MGGTFDPIHYWHLVAAQEAAWELSLPEVMFIPTRQPPHKLGELVSDAQHRLAMTRLATTGNPLFTVSMMEIERQGPSYTVDTLRALRDRDLDVSFIVGMDSLRDLPTWHDPEGILELAEIATVYRGGLDVVDLDALERQLPKARGRVRVIPIPTLDISSTEIRSRVAAGHPIRYLVPEAVEAYIHEHSLYRE
jgi:nicotinate-nucleotide adenylyltransferase